MQGEPILPSLKSRLPAIDVALSQDPPNPSALMARISSLFLRTRQQYQTLDCTQTVELGHGDPNVARIRADGSRTVAQLQLFST